MKKAAFTAAVILVALAIGKVAQQDRAQAQQSSAAGGLFPNDFGPAAIDVSSYPKQYQETYKVFLQKCSVCHTIARPINSQFLEMSEAEQAQMKKTQPELFKDPKILEIDPHIWSRYVHRMMDKPGCPVGKDGKRIWQFLVYDSIARKTGKNFASWKKMREKLVKDFKIQHPARYKELFNEGQ
ncbi:MAG: hypothetical protein KGL04_05835 [Elusimicrobia bacterium]|nr:hypothetical protein [Elusimicrobiota bacterium]